jgi:hypothetical protein
MADNVIVNRMHRLNRKTRADAMFANCARAAALLTHALPPHPETAHYWENQRNGLLALAVGQEEINAVSSLPDRKIIWLVKPPRCLIHLRTASG